MTPRLISFAVILALLSGCSKESSVKSVHSVETSQGKYEWEERTRTVEERDASTTREITEAELSGIRSDAKLALAFISKYAPGDRPNEELPASLDAAFAAWLKSTDPKREDSETVIRILGSSFGSYCVERLNLRWAVIEDKFGVEIALVRPDIALRSFPFSSIRYRIEDRKTDFIYPLYLSLAKITKDSPPPTSIQSTKP